MDPDPSGFELICRIRIRKNNSDPDPTLSFLQKNVIRK